MGKDLAAVQQKTAEIVKETAGTPNAPYNYILVTFNDPGKAAGNSCNNDVYYLKKITHKIAIIQYAGRYLYHNEQKFRKSLTTAKDDSCSWNEMQKWYLKNALH